MDYGTRHEGVVAPLTTVGGSGPVSAVDEEPEHTDALHHTVILQISHMKHCCVQRRNQKETSSLKSNLIMFFTDHLT